MDSQMNPRTNPTRIVALCLCAFAVIGVVAVGLFGDGESKDEAVADTVEYVPVQSVPREAARPVEESRASSADYESWVEEPASESESVASVDNGESSGNVIEQPAASGLNVPQEVPQ